MSNAVIASLSKRRTQYALGKSLSLSKEQIAVLIQQAIKLSPSAFNSQSSRALILFGAESDALWDIAKHVLKKMLPAEAFIGTEKKLSGFAAGVGTVLFFEDQHVIENLQKEFALYAENFPIWSEHASGMAQLSVWSALAEAGIGASLQHYNPLLDAEVAARWQVPGNWKLRAQMPFGSNEASFPEKSFIADADRFIVKGA